MKEKRKLLSICMIVKDEIKYIENCIESMKFLLQNNIAELIIVDTGSKDNTIEVCKKYTKNIYYKKWNNNFSEARNYSISKATGEYIFIQDADQEIDENSKDKMLNLFITKEYKKYKTIYLKVRNYLDFKLNKYSELKFPLIFKNDSEFKYIGAVHNQPLMKEPIKYVDIQINHYGYIMDEKKKKEKFDRTAGILITELNKNPKNNYYRFQLAKSYNSVNLYKEALVQVDLYLGDMVCKELVENDLKYFRTAAQTYFLNNQFKKCLHICDIVLKRYEDFLDCLYLKGKALCNLKMYRESNIFFEKYLKIISKKIQNINIENFSYQLKNEVEYCIENNIRKIKMIDYSEELKKNLNLLLNIKDNQMFNLVSSIENVEFFNEIVDSDMYFIFHMIYRKSNKYYKALEYIDKAIELKPNCFELIYNKACVLKSMKKYDEAIYYYRNAEKITKDENNLMIINKSLLECIK